MVIDDGIWQKIANVTVVKGYWMLNFRTLKFVAILAVVPFSSPAEAQTKILFNVLVGPNHFVNGPFRAWASDVRRVTSGRVQKATEDTEGTRALRIHL
jgi:hypothetical protein